MQKNLMDRGKKIITSFNPFGRASGKDDEVVEEFWVLKDVNFEINMNKTQLKNQHGECSGKP
jgi:hypothetical protein